MLPRWSKWPCLPSRDSLVNLVLNLVVPPLVGLPLVVLLLHQAVVEPLLQEVRDLLGRPSNR